MGIYGAINSAVSGLAAQSRALENLSGNVANSQTVGYKRLDTSFSDMVSGGGDVQQQQVSGTARATSRATNVIQGDIKGSDVDTYMAINGPGYFPVSTPSGIVDGRPTFSGSTYYTRAGDFKLDRTGLMVNSAGYYLKGLKLDDRTGNPVGDTPEVIKIDNTPMAARQTKTVDYQTSLPTVPKTGRYDGSTRATALLDPVVGSGDVTATNTEKFVKSSISGGSTTVYNSNGTPLSVGVRWAKIAYADPAAVPAVKSTWAMYVGTGGGDPSYKKVGEATIGPDGKVDGLTGVGGFSTVAPGTKTFTIPSLTVGDTTTTNLDISFGTGKLTEWANEAGVAASTQLDQDGFAAGKLTGLSVTGDGQVMARYSNSQTRGLYKIPLATFQAAHNLRRMNGAAFETTSQSGPAYYREGGSIVAKSLELSNADIASEFSKLIITQQAYSANSRVVTSSNDMLKDALNMVR